MKCPVCNINSPKIYICTNFTLLDVIDSIDNGELLVKDEMISNYIECVRLICPEHNQNVTGHAPRANKFVCTKCTEYTGSVTRIKDLVTLKADKLRLAQAALEQLKPNKAAVSDKCDAVESLIAMMDGEVATKRIFTRVVEMLQITDEKKLNDFEVLLSKAVDKSIDLYDDVRKLAVSIENTYERQVSNINKNIEVFNLIMDSGNKQQKIDSIAINCTTDHELLLLKIKMDSFNSKLRATVYEVTRRIVRCALKALGEGSASVREESVMALLKTSLPILGAHLE